MVWLVDLGLPWDSLPNGVKLYLWFTFSISEVFNTNVGSPATVTKRKYAVVTRHQCSVSTQDAIPYFRFLTSDESLNPYFRWVTESLLQMSRWAVMYLPPLYIFPLASGMQSIGNALNSLLYACYSMLPYICFLIYASSAVFLPSCSSAMPNWLCFFSY